MESKKALDKIINKSRVHLYKPIQIAEILYYYRTHQKINPNDLESYRNISKRWRDDISRRLVGRISTSSQKFQDNLFEDNAMPPKLLAELAEFNNRTSGLVEAYIYFKLKERLSMVTDALNYIEAKGTSDFNLQELLNQFIHKPGLRRSIDKVYEITVYALFSTLVRALNVEISLSIKNADKQILKDFDRFVEMILGLSKNKTTLVLPARLFRVGATNAADRGLDMWANFGPAIQVKHLSLSEELAEEITESISADRIILVCLGAEAKTIEKVLRQLPFSDRIQGIITVSDLIDWYSICLSKKYRSTLGKNLLNDLKREFNFEFPSSAGMEPFLAERKYSLSKLVGEWKLGD
jgi:type II restriction enzyme